LFYPSQDYAPIGSLKARYRPLGLVAQGQFGKVYCAVHRASGRLVALKLLDRQRSTTSQFLRELSSLLTLRHPALTQLRAIEQTEAGRCLVLDYSSGGTLRQLLESPVLPRRDLMLGCLLQILEGLAYAHRQGIIHCDVKPENILVRLDPQGWRACLTDFGIAQSHLGSDVIGCIPELECGGSPAYMAPERFAGEAYRASDLYSVGIILYEVLLGDRPFHGSPNALREAHRQEAVKFSKPLDIASQKLLYRALSKSPDLRYASAEAMAESLRKALKTASPQPGRAAPTTAPLFTQLTSEAALAWPDRSLIMDWPLPELEQPELEPSLAGRCCVGILPAMALAPISQQATAAERAAVADSVFPAVPNKLPPQLWVSRGLNLKGLVLNGPSLPSDCSKSHPSGAWQRLALAPADSSLAIRDVVLNAGSGFALTRTALYRWSLAGECDLAQPQLQKSKVELERPLLQPPPSPPSLHCLFEGQSDLRKLVLLPQGRWAGIIKGSSGMANSRSQPDPPHSLLLLSLEHNRVHNRALSSPSQALADPKLQSAQESRPVQASQPVRELQLAPSEALLGLQLLDRRHGAALLTAPKQSQRLGLFSRRGQWLNSFALPVAIQHWVRGMQSYELWAIELGHPKILLKLRLKPFQVQRIPLAMAPDQICPMPWGCVLANQAGTVLLLNRDGQSLGQLQVPLPSDTQRLWLLPITQHSLVVVMERSQSFRLLTLDLRQLELMLVF